MHICTYVPEQCGLDTDNRWPPQPVCDTTALLPQTEQDEQQQQQKRDHHKNNHTVHIYIDIILCRCRKQGAMAPHFLRIRAKFCKCSTSRLFCPLKMQECFYTYIRIVYLICVMVRGRKLGGSKSTAGLHSRCSPATLM